MKQNQPVAVIAADGQLRRKDLILWGFLLIAELIMLFVGITHEGVWFDEACSVGIIRHPLWQIWNLMTGDMHPPLYFLLLKIFTVLFGNSLLVLRTFSLLGILALFALGIGPVRRACGRTAGIIFSFLVMTTPIYLAEAQEIRMYSWTVFLVTGTLLYAYLALAENKKSDWIKCGVLMLAAIYTHYYALLAIVILSGVMVIWFWKAKKQLPLMFWVIAGGVILGYLPWLSGFFTQLKWMGNGKYWIPRVGGATIWLTLIYPYGYKFFINDPFAGISFGLAAGLIVAGLGIAAFKRRKATVAYLAIGVYILTILVAMIFSCLFWPILVGRYILPVSGLLILAVAFGLAQLPDKKLIAVFAVIFLGLMIPHLITINQSRFNGPVQEITGYIKENLKPGDVFIHLKPESWGVLCYYFPGYQQFIYTIQSNPGFAYCKTFEPNGSGGLDLSGFLKNKHPHLIWLVDEEFGRINSAPKIFSNQVILETKLFKIPESLFAVRVYKIKLKNRS